MIFKFFTELLHNRNRWHSSRVAERTESSAQHVFREILNVVDVFLHPAARMEAVERLLEPVRAFAARDAPATALVLVELHDVLREADHAGGVVDDDHTAGTQHGAGFRDAVKIHGDVDLVRGENWSRRPAWNDSLNLLASGNTTAHVVDHLLQTVAQGQFVHAGLVDVAAQAEEAHAAVFRCSVIGELLGAIEQDVRGAGESLNIINDRGRSPQSNDSREGRLDARHAALAFERFHQCGLFTDFVGASAAVPVNVKSLAATENALAQKTLGIGIADCLLHDDREVTVFAADVDVAALRVYGEARNHDAFNHGMRIVFQNQAVFAGAWLAFGESFGTKDHFIPVGNPAPPRPRNPDVLISPMMASGGMTRAFCTAL